MVVVQKMNEDKGFEDLLKNNCDMGKDDFHFVFSGTHRKRQKIEEETNDRQSETVLFD